MSKGGNSPGVSKFAGIIREIAQKEQSGELLLDFGVIQGDYSLLTNTYPIPIPSSDYLVCRGVALPNKEVITSNSTKAENESHGHSVSCSCGGGSASGVTVTQKGHSHGVNIARPSQRMLTKGDRVLVAWVQNDAVVVDIILPASTIKEGG